VRAQIQPAATSTVETAPIPADQIPKEVTDAINSPDRPAADKALDAGRRPDQIMAFYGIKPGMKIADIFAAGFLPDSHTRKIAATTASSSEITIRFRSFRSMLSYSKKSRATPAARHTKP